MLSKAYKSSRINDNYRHQDFTIRKITDNLPIAGKNTKGSLFPPSLCKCFSKIFLKRKVKIIAVQERYKFIKLDRILSAENIKLSALKF